MIFLLYKCWDLKNLKNKKKEEKFKFNSDFPFPQI